MNWLWRFWDGGTAGGTPTPTPSVQFANDLPVDALESIVYWLHQHADLVNLFGSNEFAWIEEGPASEQLPAMLLSDLGETAEHESDGHWPLRIGEQMIAFAVFGSSRGQCLQLARKAVDAIESDADLSLLRFDGSAVLRCRLESDGITLESERDQISGRDVWAATGVLTLTIEANE